MTNGAGTVLFYQRQVAYLGELTSAQEDSLRGCLATEEDSLLAKPVLRPVDREYLSFNSVVPLRPLRLCGKKSSSSSQLSRYRPLAGGIPMQSGQPGPSRGPQPAAIPTLDQIIFPIPSQ